MQGDADGGPPALTARGLVGVVRDGPHRCRHLTEIPSGHPTTPSTGRVAPIFQMRTLGSDRFSVGSRPSAGEEEHESLGDLATHPTSSLAHAHPRKNPSGPNRLAGVQQSPVWKQHTSQNPACASSDLALHQSTQNPSGSPRASKSFGANWLLMRGSHPSWGRTRLPGNWFQWCWPLLLKRLLQKPER